MESLCPIKLSATFCFQRLLVLHSVFRVRFSLSFSLVYAKNKFQQAQAYTQISCHFYGRRNIVWVSLLVKPEKLLSVAFLALYLSQSPVWICFRHIFFLSTKCLCFFFSSWLSITMCHFVVDAPARTYLCLSRACTDDSQCLVHENQAQFVEKKKATGWKLCHTIKIQIKHENSDKIYARNFIFVRNALNYSIWKCCLKL